MITYYPTWI